MPMMATAIGLLLPGAERAKGVASLVSGLAAPAVAVDSPIALFPMVGETVSVSKSMPVSMSVVGSAA